MSLSAVVGSPRNTRTQQERDRERLVELRGVGALLLPPVGCWPTSVGGPISVGADGRVRQEKTDERADNRRVKTVKVKAELPREDVTTPHAVRPRVAAPVRTSAVSK